MTLEEAEKAIFKKLHTVYGMPDEDGNRPEIIKKATEYTPEEAAQYIPLSMALAGIQTVIRLNNEGKL